MNDDVPSWGDLRIIPPKDFADAAADSIAYHRASQRFLHAGTEAAPQPAIGAIKNDELPRGSAGAAAIDCFKFGAAHQPRGAGETLRRTLGGFKWA